MPYTIKKTDGTILLTLGDTRINQVSTSLTLIGKDVEAYGEYFNNNLVGLLENFASTQEPRAPLVGQLWYNKSIGKIYVYTESKTFKPVGGSLISSSQPETFDQGDLWIDTENKQLWFSPTGEDFVLAGPVYSSQDGKSGWVVEAIKDINKVDQIVACLYIKNTLMAIASTLDFTFDVPFNGMNSVQVGINLNQSIPNVRFIGTATSSESFNGFTSEDYYQKNDDIVTDGYVWAKSLEGIKAGPDSDVIVYVDEFSAGTIEHTREDTFFRIKSNNAITGPFDAVTVSPSKQVGILNENPAYDLDIGGNTRIQGNLIVEGTNVSLESTVLTVNDKNIELAYGQPTPSDVFIEGGGIILHGTTDRTITWTQNLGNSWEINDNLNLTSPSHSYKISGYDVVTRTALGSTIQSAEGLTKLGFLTYLTVTNVKIEGHSISTTATSSNLVLTTADPSATIDVNGRKITSLSNPTLDYDAATKKYVDDTFSLPGTKGFTFSIDVTNAINTNTFVISFLDRVLPVTNPPPDDVFDLPDGVRARVICVSSSVNIPQQTLSLSKSTTLVNGTQTVLTNVAGILPTFGVIPTYLYQVKEFRIVSGTWQYDSDIP